MTQQWNSSHNNANNTLSNSNLTTTATAASTFCATYASESVSSGKYYWEITTTGGGFNGSGEDSAGAGIGNTTSSTANGVWLGSATDSLSYFGDGRFYNNGASIAGPYATYTQFATVLCFALDLTNNKCWARVGSAGNWLNDVIGNQNPASNIGGVSIPAAVYASPVVPGVSLFDGLAPDTATAAFASASWAGTAPSGFVAFDAAGLDVTSVSAVVSP